jgi:hypothetical protein
MAGEWAIARAPALQRVRLVPFAVLPASRAATRSERIEAVVIVLRRDPPGAELEEEGEVRANPRARRECPDGHAERRRPHDLERHSIVLLHRVPNLVPLIRNSVLPPLVCLSKSGEIARGPLGRETIGELALHDVGREERVDRVARFDGAEVRVRSIQV